MKSKKFKITLLVLLTLDALAKANPIKKTDALTLPVGESSVITWGDMNELTWKINGVFVTIFLWFLVQIYDSYKKSKDTTSQDIRELKDLVSKLVSEIEHRPTFRDIYEMRDKEP